ncbi:MAG: hypothetical protein ACPG5U_07895 [Planktomarina sp.]
MKFIFHGGFHKTGTNNIQRALLSQMDWLSTKSTMVLPPVDAKRMGLNISSSVREDGLARLDEKRPNRLIISDEALFGNIGQVVFTGDLHRFPARPIDAYLTDFDTHPTDILLCVRDYGAFFSAAYAGSIGPLAAKRFAMPDVAALKVMGNMPTWVRLITTVLKKFPNARVTLYRYEDHEAIQPKIFDYFLGTDVAEKFMSKTKDVIAQPVPETPTQPMMDRFFKHLNSVGLIDAYRDWQDTMRYDWIEGPEFSICTAQQADHLTKTYNSDWEELRSYQNITMLEP